jgi:hypothetical protein
VTSGGQSAATATAPANAGVATVTRHGLRAELLLLAAAGDLAVSLLWARPLLYYVVASGIACVIFVVRGRRPWRLVDRFVLNLTYVSAGLLGLKALDDIAPRLGHVCEEALVQLDLYLDRTGLSASQRLLLGVLFLIAAYAVPGHGLRRRWNRVVGLHDLVHKLVLAAGIVVGAQAALPSLVHDTHSRFLHEDRDARAMELETRARTNALPALTQSGWPQVARDLSRKAAESSAVRRVLADRAHAEHARFRQQAEQEAKAELGASPKTTAEFRRQRRIVDRRRGARDEALETLRDQVQNLIHASLGLVIPSPELGNLSREELTSVEDLAIEASVNTIISNPSSPPSASCVQG